MPRGVYQRKLKDEGNTAGEQKLEHAVGPNATVGEVIGNVPVKVDASKMHEGFEEAVKPKKQPKFLPFTGKDSLPPWKTIGGAKVSGDRRYYAIGFAQNNQQNLKLVSVCRLPSGIKKKCEAVLKPYKKNARGANDRLIIQQLKACGIPGVY